MFGDSYRECCYNCKYTNPNRISDITIGDYWGIEKENIKIQTNKGVTAVIINTEKGEKLFNIVKEGNEIYPGNYNNLKLINTALTSQVKRKKTRDTIYQELTNSNFNYLINHRYKPSTLQYIKGKIKGICPPFLFYIIKKYT